MAAINTSLNTNYPAPTSLKNLQQSQAAQGQNAAMDRLRFKRIEPGDSDGVAISQSLSARVGGVNPSGRNANDANDAISLTQMAEVGLRQVDDTLQRMRDLATQSANGSNSDADRQNLQQQFGQLADEMDRLAKTTQYNGQNLLDGSFTGATFQVGGNSISVGAIADTRTAALGRVTSGTATAENRQGLDITTQAGALEARDRIDAALKNVQTTRDNLGESTNQIQAFVSDLATTASNLRAANSRVSDADSAQELASMVETQIRSQPSMAFLAQANFGLPASISALLRS